MTSPNPKTPFRFREYVVAGILALIPLWVTVLIVTFLYDMLGNFGGPLVAEFAEHLGPDWPMLNAALQNRFVQTLAFVVVAVAGLYALGVFTSRLVGRRLAELFDAIIKRIPLVQFVYSATKKFVDVFKNKPSGNLQRVVLINFPSNEMKAVGFVTRMLTDVATGRQLAAVYVPTTPNPTSGYMQLVPVEIIISTTWTVDEAMTYIISGGAVAPDAVHYSASAEPKP